MKLTVEHAMIEIIHYIAQSVTGRYKGRESSAQAGTKEFISSEVRADYTLHNP